MKKIEFSSRVFPEPNTGCWLWAGPVNGKGHGRIRPENHSGFRYSHRYSYYLNNGDFDRNLCVLHKCDVPQCVNPDHLFLGTVQDNIIDCVTKGRHMRGVKSSHAVFTEADIVRIRELYKSGVKTSSIANEYCRPYITIHQIVTRKTWKHV